MEPDQVLNTGWRNYIQADLLVPSDVEYTCNKGKGRLLDYAFTSRRLAAGVRLWPDLHGPWKPHMGLMGEVDLEVKQQLVRYQQVPQKIEVFQGPRRKTWTQCWDQTESGFSWEAPFPLYEQAASEDLTRLYMKFSAATETYMLETAVLEEAEYKGYMGRGGVPLRRCQSVFPPNVVK